eukprot:SAG11_NODE_21960_length_415_cov_0.651899_1_plen_57_part_01
MAGTVRHHSSRAISEGRVEEAPRADQCAMPFKTGRVERLEGIDAVARLERATAAEEL